MQSAFEDGPDVLKKIIRRVCTAFTSGLLSAIGLRNTRRLLVILQDALSGKPAFPGLLRSAVVNTSSASGVIQFYCIGDLPVWRAETLLTKEPETISWLDSMSVDDILYDVGANVGAYSLYAAKCRGARVLAFEPMAANYYLLNRNIDLNELSDQVAAYCLALNDQDALDRFYIQNLDFGAALSSFAVTVDQKGETYEPRFEQGMVGMGLDTFIAKFDPPFPTFIKIDVDGIEDKVIAGAAKTLSDSRLLSVSIELDSARPEYTEPIVYTLEKSGLKLITKQRAAELDGTPFASTYNYQFRR